MEDEEQLQQLWQSYTAALADYENHPTELGRARVIRNFTDWAWKFDPDSANSTVARLRANLARPT